MLEHLELVIFGLLVAVAGLVQLSYVLKVPYPVFLVLGGLALGLIPGLPMIELPPDLVFLIFLPTDPVAATAIANRLGMPRRIVTILEGESLINDGMALVLYRTVVAAAVVGSFSVFEAGLDFVLSSIGGGGVGFFVGGGVARIKGKGEGPPA